MTGDGSGLGRTVAGRYRLLEALGAGGMGRVWLARDLVLECEVALKEILLPPGIDAEDRAERIVRAQREARHAARLRTHPNVVTLLDAFEEGGLPWLVMEYVPSRDLTSAVAERGPLPVAETAAIGTAVLDALTAGHRTGIVHRDVKPGNILLAQDGRVLLTDYGIAMQEDDRPLTRTGAFVGSPGFFAPERARGEPQTAASDLFSLGATLYFTVEGRSPFGRDTPVATLSALLFDDPLPPVRAGALGPVLLGLLAKEPTARLSPDRAAAMLRACLAATDSRAPSQPQPQPQSVPQQQPQPLPQAQPQPPYPLPPVSPQASGQGWSAPPPGPQTPTQQAPHSWPPQGGYHQHSAPQPYAGLPDARYPSGPQWTGAPQQPGPPFGPPPGPRRRRPLVIGLVVALAAAVSVAIAAASLAGNGKPSVGTAGSSPPAIRSAPSALPTGTVRPYGTAAGIGPLKVGNCLKADWPGARLSGTPRLRSTTCTRPDAQVLATVTATSATSAEAAGRAACRSALTSLLRSMPRVSVYPLAPDAAGWRQGHHETACLVLPTYDAALDGRIGSTRGYGSTIYMSTAAVGDCVRFKRASETPNTYGYDTVSMVLASCSASHSAELVGFINVAGRNHKTVADHSPQWCADRYRSLLGGTPTISSYSLFPEDDLWAEGFRSTACFVKRADDKPLTAPVHG